MVNIGYLFPLIYFVNFFDTSFGYDVSAIGSSIDEAAFSEPAIEDFQDRPRRAFALLVPLENDESVEEHHKSKRCWKARPLGKMRISCNPDEVYKTKSQSTGRTRYNRKKFAGLNNVGEEEHLPRGVSYVKLSNDLHENEKHSVEESKESSNSDERPTDNSGEKMSTLRIAAIKNPKENLKDLFDRNKKSRADTASNEYDENSEDIILKKIKNHLNSDDYNVLALVGKRADRSSANKSKKFFCYCSEPNCPDSNCQRITYRAPFSTRRNFKPGFIGRANNCQSNNGKSNCKNSQTHTVNERIPLNFQYPVRKNYYNEYPTNSDILLKNDPRVSSSLGKPLQSGSTGEADHKGLQFNQPALIDGHRSHEFLYGNPRGTFHINRNHNNMQSNADQYRIFSGSNPGANTDSSNQYLLSQPKPPIGNVYPVITVQPNTNNYHSPYSQWAVSSYDPFRERTGNQIPSNDDQIVTQDSFKARDTDTEFVDSTVPLTSQGIVGSFQKPGASYSQTLGTIQPEVVNLHPIANDAYSNKFVGNSHRGSNAFNWNLQNGMRFQPYYSQQHYYQDPSQRLVPAGAMHTINHQEVPESTSNYDEDLTAIEERIVLNEKKNESVENDGEMDTQFDFKDTRFDLSTESYLGVGATSEMSNENYSNESLDNNPEDESYKEDLEHGNEDPQITIDDSTSTTATRITMPLFYHEKLRHGEYPENVNRVGDSAKIYSNYEDVTDEVQKYKNPSISSEIIHHSSSDEFHDTSSSDELLGSKNEDAAKVNEYSISNDNTGYSIDETSLRTQIERPTMEVNPARNRYGDEVLSGRVIQPENNYYRFNPDGYPTIDYNPICDRPRLDQNLKFIPQSNEDHRLLHQFPFQGMINPKEDSVLAKSQPKFTGMEESDRVFVSNGVSTGLPASTDDNYSFTNEERNGHLISDTYDNVGKISDKNIDGKETESTHFSEFVAKSSGNSDPRYDPTQYDVVSHTSDYGESFDASNEKSSKESDSEENNFAVRTDATQSVGDDSDEFLTMKKQEVLESSDAVLTGDSKRITEDGTRIIDETSNGEIVGKNQPIENQEENENIPGELESDDHTTNLDSQRINVASMSDEESGSEILGEKLMESEHELETTEGKNDNYKIYSSMEKQTLQSNEEMIDEDDNDEDKFAKNEPLIPEDISKEGNAAAASAGDKSSRTRPEHVDADGEDSMESYEDDNSQSEEYNHSTVFSTGKNNPTVSIDENSERVGAAKIEHVTNEDEIVSYLVHNEPELLVENLPTKYFSSKDRVLEYIKNHSADLVASKWLTTTERDEEHVVPLIYHTEQADSEPQSDEIYSNLSQSDDDSYDDKTEISSINDEQKTVNIGTSKQSSKEDNSSKKKEVIDEGNNYPIHLTENKGNNLEAFDNYEDNDNSAFYSESNASESDEIYENTDHHVKQFHVDEDEESGIKLSSILEHRKNSADDELTQNYGDAPEFVADTRIPLKTHRLTEIAENNEEDATEFTSVEIVGPIHHRGNFENEKFQTSTEYPETSDSSESQAIKYDNTFSKIKDLKKKKEFAEIAEPSKESIATTYHHNPAESIERSMNLGNSKGLETGSNHYEQGMTHLQQELSPHEYHDSESSEDLEPSKESEESIADPMTGNSPVWKYTLRNDRGKAGSTMRTTSTCGYSVAGGEVTTDENKNEKIILINDFLSSSNDRNGKDMMPIKHREDYKSEEETTSTIETQEIQSQEALNRKHGELNADENLSLELDKNVHDFSEVNPDQYVGIRNPATKYMSGHSIATMYHHNPAESVERSVNVGHSNGLETGSNHYEQEITLLQQELSPHEYDDSESSEDLEPSKESEKSIANPMTGNSPVWKYTLRNDRDEAGSAMRTISTCGCSVAGGKVMRDKDKNEEGILVNDFLSASNGRNGKEMVTIKHQENYNSEGESTSTIETQEIQPQEALNRKHGELNADENPSLKLDKNAQDLSKEDPDQFVGIKNPATKYMSGQSIATMYDHNPAESVERSANEGNLKGLKTGSNHYEQGITHLQKELLPHEYDDSESSEDLGPWRESQESIADPMTGNSPVWKYTLRNDRGKAGSTMRTTSTCGYSVAGGEVTTDKDKNEERILINNFLSSSDDRNGKDMVAIKHRANYESEEDTTSTIGTQEVQPQVVFNRNHGELNADENLSLELDKNVHDLSNVDPDPFVGIENPAMQSTTGSSSSDVKVDQDEKFLQYSSESEDKQYSKLYHHNENGRDADIVENLPTPFKKTFFKDQTEDITEGNLYYITQGTKSVENWHSGSHDSIRDESSASIQVEKNSKSESFSREVKNAEFIGSARSQQYPGSCTKPPEVEDDVGYLGRLAPKKSNAEVKTLNDLLDSDLYYIGDGVRLPLTIKKLKDGSFALSISDKICEQRMVERCPCCVPREGKILQEKHSEYSAGEPLEKIDPDAIPIKGKPGTNEDVIKESEALNYGEHQLERNERALDIDNETKHHKRATRSITMPVDEFIEKYNLNLNLEDVQEPENLEELTGIESRLKHNIIQRDEAEDHPEEQKSILMQKLASMNEVPQNVSANVLLTTLKNLIATEPADIHAAIDGIKKELNDVEKGEQSGEHYPEKKISGVRNDPRGYQKGNLILDRIAIIKELQNKKYKCEHRYQKDCHEAITAKTKLLTTILYWLKDLVAEQQELTKLDIYRCKME